MKDWIVLAMSERQRADIKGFHIGDAVTKN